MSMPDVKLMGMLRRRRPSDVACVSACKFGSDSHLLLLRPRFVLVRRRISRCSMVFSARASRRVVLQ